MRSIRIRIILPVVLATAGMIALGVVQSRDALIHAEEGRRARLLAQTAAAAVTIVHQMELEYAEINLLRQRGGQAGAQLLTAAQARTDLARARFDAVAREARKAHPGLGPPLDDLARAMSLLPALRTLAPAGSESSSYLFDIYDAVSEEAIGVADAVAGQLSDPELVEMARSVALAADLEHLGSEQLDLLRQVFARQQLRPGELVQLARWAGSENQQRESLERLSGPSAELFEKLVVGPDVEQATDLRDAVLARDPAPTALQVDPDVWLIAQMGKLRRLRLVEIELTTQLEHRAFEIQAESQGHAVIASGLTVAVVAATLVGAAIIAMRTSRRLRRVRDAALTLARAELPGAVARVSAATKAETVRQTLHQSATRMDGMLSSGGGDEIGELNVAFGAVHRQALRLAADQALLRMEVEAMFVALSRRGQSLVQRQIHLIDEFGQLERDPNRLARIFAMEQVATRMRRNEENLLVLAGGEPGRRFLSPVPIGDVIRAAAEEIEDDSRVESSAMPPLAVMAHAVGDVIHLLAELLENAASFSPPTAKVRVTGRQTVEYLSITVFDEGIGMPPDKLAEANERLAHPSALTSTLVGTMGLLVVARRHGIRVQLNSTPGGGTAVTVALPERILAPVYPEDQLRRTRLRGTPTPLPIDQVVYQVTVLPPPRGTDVHPAVPAPVYAPAARNRAEDLLTGRPSIFTTTPARPVHYVTDIDVAIQAHEAGPPADAGRTPPYQGWNGAQRVDVSPVPVGYTPSGLPRRKAGGALPAAPDLYGARPAEPTSPAGPMPRPPSAVPVEPRPAGPPDPDEVRARLSSLASGIAAAQRRDSDPPAS